MSLQIHTLPELRNGIFKSATRYTDRLSTYSSAKISLIDRAIIENRCCDSEGWVFIGDVVKEFNDIRGQATKQGELHWINLFTEAPYHCVRYKVKIIKYPIVNGLKTPVC